MGLFKFSGGEDDSLLTPPLTAFILNLESNKELLELFVLDPEKIVFKNVNHRLYCQIYIENRCKTYSCNALYFAAKFRS